MPLLMCPNDNAAMQTLERGGVQFDMCPSCRGVWLDRGELEKLMESAARDAVPAAPPPTPPAQGYAPGPYPPQAAPTQPWGGSGYRDGRYDDDRHKDSRYGDDRYRGDDPRYKKKKRDSIFDIFD
jgi:uncharacterized protein